jgi:hypothetical protein
MALGGDFEALKQLAKQQDADRQANLARERAAKEQQAAKAQAARDARERQERENSRRLLKLKEDQKKRKAEAEEEMEMKRAELRKRKREREQKAEEVAKTTKTKLITSKMIRQREKAGLGGRKSKVSSSKRRIITCGTKLLISLASADDFDIIIFRLPSADEAGEARAERKGGPWPRHKKDESAFNEQPHRRSLETCFGWVLFYTSEVGLERQKSVY